MTTPFSVAGSYCPVSLLCVDSRSASQSWQSLGNVILLLLVLCLLCLLCSACMQFPSSSSVLVSSSLLHVYQDDIY